MISSVRNFVVRILDADRFAIALFQILDIKSNYLPGIVQDANTLRKAKSDLKKLQTCPIASCVRNACQSNNPECDFEKLYGDCKLQMVDVRYQAGLDDSSMDTDDQHQCMS
jgi:hypothetical protein